MGVEDLKQQHKSEQWCHTKLINKLHTCINTTYNLTRAVLPNNDILLPSLFCVCMCVAVSYTHLTLPTRRTV